MRVPRGEAEILAGARGRPEIDRGGVRRRAPARPAVIRAARARKGATYRSSDARADPARDQGGRWLEGTGSGAEARLPERPRSASTGPRAPVRRAAARMAQTGQVSPARTRGAAPEERRSGDPGASPHRPPR